MIFGLFGKRTERRAPVDALFARIAEASRRPELYRAAGIPDSFEGRFEALVLHVFLVLRRLKALPAPAGELSQELVDSCFAYLELGFRNGGVSDIAVPKRMKKIAQSFYGRVKAYETALSSEDAAALVEALRRNAGVADGAGALAAYVRRSQTLLATCDLAALLDTPHLFPAFSSPEQGDDR